MIMILTQKTSFPSFIKWVASNWVLRRFFKPWNNFEFFCPVLFFPEVNQLKVFNLIRVIDHFISSLNAHKLLMKFHSNKILYRFSLFVFTVFKPMLILPFGCKTAWVNQCPGKELLCHVDGWCTMWDNYSIVCMNLL